MGRNSGKRIHRKGKFAPPPVPKSEALKPHQCYGVITKYHGGTQRNMDVTIYDAETNSLKNIWCKLKGSLRHLKCKQRILLGSYVVTDYEDVIIIFTPSQLVSIPEPIFNKLSTVHHSPGNHDDSDVVGFAASEYLSEDEYPDPGSDLEDERDDEPIDLDLI